MNGSSAAWLKPWYFLSILGTYRDMVNMVNVFNKYIITLNNVVHIENIVYILKSLKLATMRPYRPWIL